MSATPVITRMEVIPVAGYDSMLMTLSGAHAPVFTRNIVILTDSSGHEGIGEIHGGDYALSFLRDLIPLVEGREIGSYRHILQDIHKIYDKTRKGSDDLQTLDISKLKFVVKTEWALECALLDIFGQFLGLPMAELLGEGKQRDEVEILGYLFYISDKEKARGARLESYPIKRKQEVQGSSISTSPLHQIRGSVSGVKSLFLPSPLSRRHRLSGRSTEFPISSSRGESLAGMRR